MEKKEALELARRIFTSGKTIQDHVFRVQARELAARGRDTGVGEVSLAQMHMIRTARERENISITELAQCLGVSPPSASVMADRLVERGILTREPSSEDRRKVRVRVSPEAVRTIEHIEQAILQSFIDLVEKLGPSTARKWCEVLKKVQEALEQDTRPHAPEPSGKR